MKPPTEPLRREHQQIRQRLDEIRILADRVDELPSTTLAREVAEAIAFLDHGLVPHALAEDQILYPVVARAIGAPTATATMSRDHLAIGRLVDQLHFLARRLREQPSKRLRRDLRRVLYSLDAIAEVHLEKEEEIYLPLLDERLTPEAADDLFAAIRRAAHASTPRAS